MGRRPARRFTVEEKLKILEEARQPQTTVAEVLRRYGLEAQTFYRWERVAKAGMRDALAERPRKGNGAEREVERLRGSWTRSVGSLPRWWKRTSS